MSCVPCQVILWDQKATGMLESVDKLVTLKMQGAKIPLTDKWQEDWYELVKANCIKMQEMIDSLTGVHDG